MSGVATSSQFKENAHDALTDARLQGAMSFSRNFVGRRAAAAARLPEFEALRDSAKAIKDHTLAHLDLYLEAYEQKVRARDRKSTRLNSSHPSKSRMPSSA